MVCVQRSIPQNCLSSSSDAGAYFGFALIVLQGAFFDGASAVDDGSFAADLDASGTGCGTRRRCCLQAGGAIDAWMAF
jgi:hypothetical protein